MVRGLLENYFPGIRNGMREGIEQLCAIKFEEGKEVKNLPVGFLSKKLLQMLNKIKKNDKTVLPPEFFALLTNMLHERHGKNNNNKREREI